MSIGQCWHGPLSNIISSSYRVTRIRIKRVKESVDWGEKNYPLVELEFYVNFRESYYHFKPIFDSYQEAYQNVGVLDQISQNMVGRLKNVGILEGM